jgi:hypothetical protein
VEEGVRGVVADEVVRILHSGQQGRDKSRGTGKRGDTDRGRACSAASAAKASRWLSPWEALAATAPEGELARAA